MNITQTEAYEIIESTTKLDDTDPPCLLVLTCEHATQYLPPPYSWSEADQRLIDTHWAIDLGSRDLLLEITKRMKGLTSVCATTSRLLVDLNRTLSSETLFRTVADDEKVELNDPQILTESEKKYRLEKYYHPYHKQVSEAVSNITHLATNYMKNQITLQQQQNSEVKPITVMIGCIVSIHSFTPQYEKIPKREVEVGVLFDSPDEKLANKLYEKIKSVGGFDVRKNEPYSFFGVGDYSVHRALVQKNIEQNKKSIEGEPVVKWLVLEIETRQDLVVKSEWRERLAKTIAEFWVEQGFATACTL